MNNIIDHADALLAKLNDVSINTVPVLLSTIKDGHVTINRILQEAGHAKFTRTTIEYLRIEGNRTEVSNNNPTRYQLLLNDIGIDDEPEAPDGAGVRVIVEAVAASQSRHNPVRWSNEVTAKIIGSGIKSPTLLCNEIRTGHLNERIRDNGYSAFNKVTIRGLDFH